MAFIDHEFISCLQYLVRLIILDFMLEIVDIGINVIIIIDVGFHGLMLMGIVAIVIHLCYTVLVVSGLQLVEREGILILILVVIGVCGFLAFLLNNVVLGQNLLESDV